MKNFGFIRKRKRHYELQHFSKIGANTGFEFLDTDTTETKKDFDAIMLPRPDFSVKTIELPKALRESEAREYLKIKLRSIYPGNPEETEFDFKILTLKKKKYAVIFITSKKTFLKYKEISKEAPLFLPFNIALKHIKKYMVKNSVILFWHTDWIEIMVLDPDNIKGALFTSKIVKRTHDLKKDIEHVVKAIPSGFILSSCINFIYSHERELIELYVKENISTENIEDDMENHILFFSITDSLKGSISKPLINIGSDSVFLFEKGKANIRIPRIIRLQIYLFLIIIFGCFLYSKTIEAEKNYYLELKQTFGLLENQTIKIITEEKEIEGLEEELGKLKEKKPIDIYGALSEMYNILGSNVQIESFLLENDTFFIEATGTNPLGIMDKFPESKTFTDVRLPKIVQDKRTGKTFFRISGKLYEK